MHTMVSTIDALERGPAVTAANLTMFPLLASTDQEPAYLTLDEAVARGTLQVTEVSEAGMVPQLLVKNADAVPVLILDGEELVGAKQNRIVNLTILVPPRATIEIPVSCVEAGRWHHGSPGFASAGRLHYAEARAMKLEDVSASMKATGKRSSNQAAIWEDIARKSDRLGATSETQAAAAMYERAQDQLREIEHTLTCYPRQVGAVFVINGVVVGLDLFDAPATWRKSVRKLVQSYGLDALDRPCGPATGEPDAVNGFLDAVRNASGSVFRAIGQGDDVRLEGPAVAGGALVVEERVVHLVAFPKGDGRAPSSRRRAPRVV